MSSEVSLSGVEAISTRITPSLSSLQKWKHFYHLQVQSQEHFFTELSLKVSSEASSATPSLFTGASSADLSSGHHPATTVTIL